MLDSQQAVAHLVLEHSECAPILQRHRIDYCCAGNISIDAAARQRGIDTSRLVDELAHAIAERHRESAGDLRSLPTAALIALIITKHHGYLRQTLPFVQLLAAKVDRVHGDRNPRLRDLVAAVEELGGTLLPHLDMEEQTLFPALLSPTRDAQFVAGQLASMHNEHYAVGKLLECVRGTSEDFMPPVWACNSYRTLVSELAQLESDVHMHMHLENHVLKPRFE